ncbi:MAG: alpha/beta hydrolase [Pseudomonadota bacterium]
MIIGHELYGGGPDGVVVMHDFYGCRHTWDHARSYFDTERYTFAFMELRGYGSSRDFKGDYTVEEAAGDALNLASDLGWERFHVVGHSISGMVAQRVVVDGGDRVKSAILNTPVPATGVGTFAPEGLELVIQSVDDDGALRTAFDALTGNRLGDGWLNFKINQTRSTRTREAQATYIQTTQTSFLDKAEGNETPMLLIIGEYDMEPFTESTATETFVKWYPNIEMTICRNAGHYPQQEAPVFVATKMMEFLHKQA